MLFYNVAFKNIFMDVYFLSNSCLFLQAGLRNGVSLVCGELK